VAAQIFNLGKLRFTYKGAYSGSTEYQLNDVVGYTNNVYVYINTGATTGNLPTDTSYWALMVAGIIDPTTGVAGQLLSTDGTSFEWADVETIPSITNQLDKLLVATIDGVEWANTTSTFNFTDSLEAASSTGVFYAGAGAKTDNLTLGINEQPVALKAVTGNVATLTTTAAHGFAPFQMVEVALVPADPRFDGIREVLAAPSANTFTFEAVTPDVTTTVCGGTASSIPGYTNAAAAFAVNADDYAQVAFRNASNAVNASTDFIAYSDNGTDYAGWIDLGITSSNFADLEFTITGPNDGYIFMSAPFGTLGNGDLVFATGDTGQRNAIVFAAGGLGSNNTQMTIIPDESVHVEIPTPSTSPTTGAFTVAGGVGISGDLNVLGDTTITGNLTFGGGSTTTENLAVTNPMVFVGDGNTDDVVDLGLVGEYTQSTVKKYAGVVRDASDGIIKFFTDATSKPVSTVNFADAGLTYANIQVNDITATGNLTLTGGASITGATELQELREVVVDVTLASNIGTLDWTAGNLYFIATAPTGNMTFNVTNLPVDASRIMTLNVMVTQGATGYLPTVFQIGGASQTIRWVNGGAPTPTSSAGKIDIFAFSLFRTSSDTWIVYASSALGF
jgi:hypothetical protein